MYYNSLIINELWRKKKLFTDELVVFESLRFAIKVSESTKLINLSDRRSFYALLLHKIRRFGEKRQWISNPYEQPEVHRLFPFRLFNCHHQSCQFILHFFYFRVFVAFENNAAASLQIEYIVFG